MNYKVTYAIDSLDTNPIIKIFEEHYEMEEWVHDEVQRRIDFCIQHNPFLIDERELNLMTEHEYSLVKIEEI
tara:strand:- start:1171 stop:1386 length:216 start_codon:yes stop_codon:yes gene_type:complete